MADSSGQPSGAARRRREWRLRSMLRHEQQTVRMALAAALHHSAGSEGKGGDAAERRPTGTEDRRQGGRGGGASYAHRPGGTEDSSSGERPGTLAEPGRHSSGDCLPTLGLPIRVQFWCSLESNLSGQLICRLVITYTHDMSLILQIVRTRQYVVMMYCPTSTNTILYQLIWLWKLFHKFFVLLQKIFLCRNFNRGCGCQY